MTPAPRVAGGPAAIAGRAAPERRMKDAHLAAGPATGDRAARPHLPREAEARGPSPGRPSPPGVRILTVPRVDLRSDTLTMPTEGMRRAMAEAELGDDVFGEDPTVNRLQGLAAELLGKEDALFVASGTMGNLLGVLSLARSGEEVIADAHSHLFLNEGGGAAALGGVQVRQVPTEAGVMTAEQGRSAGGPVHDYHRPPTAAVVPED